jgi:hypothetical protein
MVSFRLRFIISAREKEINRKERYLERKIKWEKIQGRTVTWIEKDEKKNIKMKEIEMEKVRKVRKQRKDGKEALMSSSRSSVLS